MTTTGRRWLARRSHRQPVDYLYDHRGDQRLPSTVSDLIFSETTGVVQHDWQFNRFSYDHDAIPSILRGYIFGEYVLVVKKVG